MSGPAVARIRTAALQQNLARARAAAPGCRVLAVVKADGYGHGAVAVARALGAADALGVARFSEARALRAAGIEQPILVMSEALDHAGFGHAAELNVAVVVHRMAQVDALAALPGSARIVVWLKIDSGMGRLGIPPAGLGDALARLRAAPCVRGDPVLMTHLAGADERDDPATGMQIECFGAALDDWRGDVSLANSAGILGWPAALAPGAALRYRGCNWVRPGLMLYGVSPFAGESPDDAGLVPALEFEGRLIDVRKAPAASRVGYGGEWRAPRDSVIGVVNVGYADGYPWRLRGGATVRIRGQAAPVVGRVSMDMISVDLTDSGPAAPGDAVTLWGDAPHVAELAAAAGTTPYELLTGLGPRVERVVIRPGAPGGRG